MAEDEAAYLILSRAKLANLPDVTEGSVVIMANCGHKAFISMNGMAELERQHHGLYTVCTDCVDVAEVIMDKTQDKAYVPGALSTISKHLGWSAGQEDQFHATLRDYGFKDI